MDTSLILAAALFALVSSITPGPNNLMLAASGLTFGFRRTLPLWLGISVGFQCLLFGVALGLGRVFEAWPAMHVVLKGVGAAYLLYLAWRLWQSSAAGDSRLAEPLGFMRGALFQWVNPKAWMMTVGAASAYTLHGDDYWPSVAMLAGLFMLLGMPSTASWAAFGAAFRNLLAEPRWARRVGRGMAVLTALSCLLIVL